MQGNVSKLSGNPLRLIDLRPLSVSCSLPGLANISLPTICFSIFMWIAFLLFQVPDHCPQRSLESFTEDGTEGKGLGYSGKLLSFLWCLPCIVVQSLSPRTAAQQASLSITSSQSLLKLMSVESVMPSQPSYPLSPPSPPIFSLSQYQSLFQWVGSLHQVTKVLKLQLQHQSIKWILKVDFLEDWLVGSPCSPRDGLSRVFSNTTAQKHQFCGCSAFFMVQLLHPYMTTGKTIALTRWTLVGKVMSLLFNMLSRFVIAFLPRNKCLLILWLQLPSTVILEPKGEKICRCFHFFPFYLPQSYGNGCHDPCFLNAEFQVSFFNPS